MVPLLATAIGLGAFVDISFATGSLTGLPAPPIYGYVQPQVAWPILLSLAGAMVAAAAAWWVASRPTVPARLLLPGAALLQLGLALLVAVQGGATGSITSVLANRTDYVGDLDVVHRLGVSRFITDFPALVPHFRSYHSKTHPPGPLVLLDFLQSRWPGHLLPTSLVLAALSALVVVPTYYLGRTVAGERAARLAVLLVATSPGVVLYTVTSMDAVFATMLTAVAALLAVAVTASGRTRQGATVAGGLLAAGVSFFTYAVVFVGAFAVLYALARRGPRAAPRPLAIAAASGLVGLAALRWGIGYDPIAAHAALPPLPSIPKPPSGRHLYWIFGDPAAVLIMAGIPVAALALREVVARRASYLAALAVPLLAFYALPTSITRLSGGETERTWLFAYPFLAIAAAAYFARWEGRSGARSPVFAALIGVAALQAIVTEVIYNTTW